jgi:hypothetical protein
MARLTLEFLRSYLSAVWWKLCRRKWSEFVDRRDIWRAML